MSEIFFLGGWALETGKTEKNTCINFQQAALEKCCGGTQSVETFSTSQLTLNFVK